MFVCLRRGLALARPRLSAALSDAIDIAAVDAQRHAKGALSAATMHKLQVRHWEAGPLWPPRAAFCCILFFERA